MAKWRYCSLTILRAKDDDTEMKLIIDLEDSEVTEPPSFSHFVNKPLISGRFRRITQNRRFASK